jgi:MAE_28990/MAE_18760-like HEPN
MSLKIEYEEKKKELENYFALLQFLDSPRGNNKILSEDKYDLFTIDVDLFRVMKANCYLMLYNLIEGTVTEGLNTIFLEISTHKPSRNELTELYQKICIEYKMNVIKILQTPDQFNPFAPYLQDEAIREINIFEIKDFKRGLAPALSGYDAYIEVIGSKDISANIDADKIRKLFPAYGITSIRDRALVVHTNEDGRDIRLNTEHIVQVKNYRNKLAHGRLTYKEVGGRVSFSEINEIKKHVFKYLEEIVDNIESFLENEDYKKKDAPVIAATNIENV